MEDRKPLVGLEEMRGTKRLPSRRRAAMAIGGTGLGGALAMALGGYQNALCPHFCPILVFYKCSDSKKGFVTLFYPILTFLKNAFCSVTFDLC